MIKQLPRLYYVCVIAAKRFFRESYTYRASALSFTSILAIVPLLSVIVFFTSIFPVFTKIVAVAQDYVFSNFIPTSSQIIQTYLESFVNKAKSLPLIGMLFLIISVGFTITTIAHSLNAVWNTPIKRKHSMWLMYYAVLLVAPLLIGISLIVSSYLLSLSWFSYVPKNFRVELYFLGILSLIINTALFTMIYIIVPNCPVKFSDGLLGGFVAAILFEVVKKGFAFYILHFHSYELIYGVMATIPIFLVWIYIAWMIILFGALVSNANYQFRVDQRNKK